MKHQVDFLELLQIDYEKYPVIAVVGGGGKTSLIYRLTDELIDKGKRVIITTTTHMAGESELPFARGGDAVRVKELLDKERYVIAAEYEEDTGKYASLTDEKLEELRELCDVMLVEADGAKHHPVKSPGEMGACNPQMCGHCDQCDRAGLSGAANQSECLPYGTYLGISQEKSRSSDH